MKNMAAATGIPTNTSIRTVSVGPTEKSSVVETYSVVYVYT